MKFDKAREVFYMALEVFRDDSVQIEKVQPEAAFNAFAKLETRLKEYDRAWVIYKVRPSAPVSCVTEKLNPSSSSR